MQFAIALVSIFAGLAVAAPMPSAAPQDGVNVCDGTWAVVLDSFNIQLNKPYCEDTCKEIEEKIDSNTALTDYHCFSLNDGKYTGLRFHTDIGNQDDVGDDLTEILNGDKVDCD
jgi:hypothetical protein